MNTVTALANASPMRVSGAARRDVDTEKQKIFDEIGDLTSVKVPLNRILLAIYKAPEVTRGGIIRPDIVKDEDVYQGVAALVLKMGPHAYEQSDNMDYEWCEDDRCHVGDWVMFRRGEGLRVNVHGRECMLMNSEAGIKMVLSRPDEVF